MASILKDVRRYVLKDEKCDVFDAELLIHINSALNTLNQVGLGPEEGFAVEDVGDEWEDLMGDEIYTKMRFVIGYICDKVLLGFDPPTVGSHHAALQERIREYEWRINTATGS